MSKAKKDRQLFRIPPATLLVVVAGAIVALVAFSSAMASSRPAHRTPKRVVDEAPSAILGRTVLTNRKGLTLYSLSVEKHGRFICTGSCLALWHPLIVADGVRPTGPVKLGTIRRPEGRRQVTFGGRPLYRFDGDTKPGEAGGEGFRDVGTWHAAGPAQTSPAPTPTAPPPYPGAY